MFNFIKKRKNKKGFTLVEVLTVILIVAVIAAIALPSYKRAVEKTRATQGIATLENIAKAQIAYNALRGNYSPSFNSLPLDLRDKDSKMVTGTSFKDAYFDFALHNNNAIAVAARNNGEYSLTVDYATGKMFCSPENHPICERFGLEERVVSTPSAEDVLEELLETGTKYENGLVCDKEHCVYYDENGNKQGECIVLPNGTPDPGCYEKFGLSGIVCDDIGVCLTFEKGKAGLKCDGGICWNPETHEECIANAEGTACAEEQPIQTGFVCDKERCVYYDENGNNQGECGTYNGTPVLGCYEEFGLSGTFCEGMCVTFEKGESVLECFNGRCYNPRTGEEVCKANAEGTACAEEQPIQTGLVCDKEHCVYYDENGKEQGECRYPPLPSGNPHPDCYGELGLSGTGCNDDGICWTFEKGKLVLKCHKGGICWNPETGEEFCKANAEGTACAEEQPIQTGFVCDKERCVYYDENGNNQGECGTYNGTPVLGCYEEFGLSGTFCDEGICVTFEKGESVLKCHGGKCYNPETGKEVCKANAEGTGCAEEQPIQTGLVCDKKRCVYYDENGKAQGECSVPPMPSGTPEPVCYDEFGLSGTVCDDDGNCFTFEKGEKVLLCSNGRCYNPRTHEECIANAEGTACAKDQPIQTGLVCADDICTYYDNDRPSFSCGQYNADCFMDNGYSGTVFDGKDVYTSMKEGMITLSCSKSKSVCKMYDDGKFTGKTCTPNDKFDGCAE